MIPQLRVERLVELMTSNPTRSFCEAGNIWKAEFERELLEYTTRLKQSANDATYTIARVERAKMRGAGDEIREVDRVVERLRVRAAELLDFAKAHGLRIDELVDVLEMRRLETTAKGKTWRAGGNAMFIDRTAQQAEQAEYAREAQEAAAGVKERVEALRGVPSAFKEPVVRDWKQQN
jgi:hypothetical protein